MRKCVICGTTRNLHRHHIYGGRNRQVSEKHGFVVHLCAYHHSLVHRDNEKNLQLKRWAQREFEKTHTRAEFMAIIGKNYLEE